MFRWAVICLVISLIAGGLGLTGVSYSPSGLSLIFFALFFLGFLALIGFALPGQLGGGSTAKLWPVLGGDQRVAGRKHFAAPLFSSCSAFAGEDGKRLRLNPPTPRRIRPPCAISRSRRQRACRIRPASSASGFRRRRQAAPPAWIFQRLADRLVEDLDDLRRRAFRRGNAVETDRLESRHGLGNGGNIGYAGPALRRGDAERAYAAAARLFECEGKLSNISCTLLEMMSETPARSAIGHVHHVDLGHRLEQFRRHVHRGAVARRGIGDLPGLALQ